MNAPIQRRLITLLWLVAVPLSTFVCAASLGDIKPSSNIIANETSMAEGVVLKPFTQNSLSQITTERGGQAFIMVLWSIDCPPCLKELAHFQALKAQFTDTNFLLIATDSPVNSAAIQQVLADHKLQTLEHWIFSDSLPERLRYKIDPNWYGELPRTYFYAADHTRMAYSGMLTEAKLQLWLEQHPPSLPSSAPPSVSMKRANDK